MHQNGKMETARRWMDKSWTRMAPQKVTQDPAEEEDCLETIWDYGLQDSLPTF